MMMAHDHSEASNRSAKTLFTIGSARMKSETMEMPSTCGPPASVTSTGVAAGAVRLWLCASGAVGAARGVDCARAAGLARRKITAAAAARRLTIIIDLSHTGDRAWFPVPLVMSKPDRMLIPIRTWPNLGD